jgi:spermidine synthase
VNPREFPFHIFSFASGALALVYEVLWLRRFALLLGATAPATAATLSAFFLGMAIGSALLGNRAVRWARPLRAFGILQAGIGASALLVDPIFRFYDGHYHWIYSLFAGHPALFLGGKTIFVMIALFAPTFLMGGTLPVLAQAVAADLGGLGVRAGGLYAVNTLGATLGALSVPFALLPVLGADWSYLAASTGSLVLGGLAVVSDPGPVEQARAAWTKYATKPVNAHDARLSRALAALAFFTGLLLLSLEVYWTRMFALAHENSIYAFAVVVAVYLGGLAGGAALARACLRRGYPAKTLVVAACGVSGLLILLSPRLFLILSSGMEFLADSPGTSIYGYRVLLVAVPVMLPAIVVAGTILPLLMELAGGKGGVPAGPALGRLLAVNTTGSIIGPLLANFVVGSGLGLWWNITLVGFGLLIAMELCIRAFGVVTWPVYGRLGAFALFSVGAWLLYPGGRPFVRLNPERGERLVSVEEGSYGSVAVLEDGEHRWMTINNYYVLGGTSSARDEMMQAHLPLFLHPEPRKVAFLGIGTGITAGAASLHPVDSMVALELVPEVIRAAKVHFADANLRVLEDPRVEIRAEDARNFLKGSGRRFDVIIGDLVVPWRPGESSLLSLEQFYATRDALLPGGIYCQWLPAFQLSEEGFRVIAATFLQVYPKSMLWRGDFLADQPAVALIGQRDPAPLDAAAIDRRIAALSARVGPSNPYLSDPSGLWLFLVGQISSADSQGKHVRLNQDSRPWLELLTPGTQFARLHSGNEEPTPQFLTPLFDEVRLNPVQGSLLDHLDAVHLKWRDAGNELWKASTLAQEGRDLEAREKAMATLAGMPIPLQKSLLGRELSDSGVIPLPSH